MTQINNGIRSVKQDEIIVSDIIKTKSIADKISLAMDAWYLWINLIYTTGNGFDENSGMIKIPSPTSSNAYQRYKITKPECDFLRFYLLDLQGKQRFPLIGFHGHSRRWHLNYETYDSLELANGYINNNSLTVRAWQQYQNSLRY